MKFDLEFDLKFEISNGKIWSNLEGGLSIQESTGNFGRISG